MEETKIAETTMDVMANATGNMKVVLGTAAVTALATVGCIYAVNKCKTAIKKRKKNKKVVQVPFNMPDEVKETVEKLAEE